MDSTQRKPRKGTFPVHVAFKCHVCGSCWYSARMRAYWSKKRNKALCMFSQSCRNCNVPGVIQALSIKSCTICANPVSHCHCEGRPGVRDHKTAAHDTAHCDGCTRGIYH